jgi:hypothetical protein
MMNVFLGLLLAASAALGQDPRKPPPNPGSPKSSDPGGITFGGRTRPELLPNPYRFNAALEVVAQAIPAALEKQKLTLDEVKSRPRDGFFVIKPHIFAQGILTSKSSLEYYAFLPAADARTWTRGRYRLEIVMSPVDGQGTHVTVNAEMEGMAQDVIAGSWVKLQSKGTAENEFLIALREIIELK